MVLLVGCVLCHRNVQAFLLDVVLVGVQLTLGGTLYSHTKDRFGKSLQLDCLLPVRAA